MVIFNKYFSEIGRDLEFHLFFFSSVSSQNGHFSIPREKKVFKAWRAYIPFPFEKNYKQLHLVLQLKPTIMKKTGKQHDSTILTFKVFFERCSTFTISKTETCQSQPPHFFMLCSKHKDMWFLLLRNFGKIFPRMSKFCLISLFCSSSE